LVLHENFIGVNCIAKDNMQESAGIKARKLESPDTMVIPG
jgi:hypothetical protein